MKPIKLSKRTVGFFAFEREFLKESNHRGFVRFTGERRLQLVSNQFMERRDGSVEYRLPEDITLHDNQLVELSVGPKRVRIYDVEKRSTLAESFMYYYDIEAVHNIDIKPPKPYLDEKDFLYRLTSHWNHAKEDRLDECVALQILSCPPNTVPIGGLGSQSLNYGQERNPLKHLEETISVNLPAECLESNTSFHFGIIQNHDQDLRLRRIFERRTVPELSYNYMTLIKLTGRPLPIAIPTVIDSATFDNRKLEPDRDVLEYVLLSHFLRPVISDRMVDKFISCIKEIREDQGPQFLRLGIDIDRFAMNRVAQAFCRLNFRNTVDDDILTKSRKWLQSVFATYYEAIEHTFDTDGDAYREPAQRPASMYDELPKRERMVFKKIVELFDQTRHEVSIDEITKSLIGQLEKEDVVASLDKLYLVGYIVSYPNGKGYKPVIIDE